MALHAVSSPDAILTRETFWLHATGTFQSSLTAFGILHLKIQEKSEPNTPVQDSSSVSVSNKVYSLDNIPKLSIVPLSVDELTGLLGLPRREV